MKLMQHSHAMHAYSAHLQVDKERLVLRYGHVAKHDSGLIIQSVLPGQPADLYHQTALISHRPCNLYAAVTAVNVNVCFASVLTEWSLS